MLFLKLFHCMAAPVYLIYWFGLFLIELTCVQKLAVSSSFRSRSSLFCKIMNVEMWQYKIMPPATPLVIMNLFTCCAVELEISLWLQISCMAWTVARKVEVEVKGGLQFNRYLVEDLGNQKEIAFRKKAYQKDACTKRIYRKCNQEPKPYHSTPAAKEQWGEKRSWNEIFQNIRDDSVLDIIIGKSIRGDMFVGAPINLRIFA